VVLPVGAEGVCGVSDVQAFISIDPQMRSGRPCVNSTRIPAYVLAEYVAGGDDPAFVATYYSTENFVLPREAVLVACWYQATYEKGRWRKHWGKWAKRSHQAMWEGAAGPMLRIRRRGRRPSGDRP
jgi:uncharacterized protein (DUF433 family)